MTDILNEIKQFAAERGLPVLRDAEVPLFQDLLRQARPKRVLEIGTCIGYSTLQIAPFLSPGGTITTLEIESERVDLARSFINRSAYGNRITIMQGDAAALLDTLDGPWDFVFMDGPKGQYPGQLQKIMPKLVPGALIVADNIRYHDMMFIKGHVPHKHRTAIMRLREFIDMIEDNRHFDTVCFENGDGMTVSRWKG